MTQYSGVGGGGHKNGGSFAANPFIRIQKPGIRNRFENVFKFMLRTSGNRFPSIKILEFRIVKVDDKKLDTRK